MTSHTGRCLCGGVRFQIDQALAPIQVCHCQECQRAQGAAFAAITPVATSALRFETGSELITEFSSSPGKYRAFCQRCGSPLYSRRDDMPEVRRLRAGVIDPPVTVPVASHAYVAEQAPWCRLADDAPCFPNAKPVS
ncbi:MAG: GFA family protein [Alcanivorax sp.]